MDDCTPEQARRAVRNAIKYNDGWVCRACTDDPKGKVHYMGHNPDGLCPTTKAPGYFAKLREVAA